ncbi:MAG: ABC transporter ATP-binding protein [Bacillota bacterium]|nr:ABC transporter ATP-binding protein [Bacillota bacterium]
MSRNRTSLMGIARECLKGQRVLLAALVALIAASVAAEVFPPFIVGRVVDHNIKGGTFDRLWFWATVYLAAVFGSRLVTFAQTYLTAVIGQKALYRLRSMMADHLVRLPALYYDRTPAGDITSRLTSDVEQVNALFTTGVIAVATDLFKITGVLSAMFAIDTSLALLAMASLPFVYGVTEYFRRKIRQSQRVSRVHMGAINTYLQDSWRGFKLLKQFNAEDRFLDRFEAPQRLYLDSTNRVALFNAYFPGVQKSIEAVTTALVVYFAATRLASDQALSLGAIVAFSQLITRLFSPVQEISQEFQAFQQAMAGVERVTGLLSEEADEEPPGVSPATPVTAIAPPASGSEAADAPAATGLARSGVLRFDHVDFGYAGGVEVLHDIDLAVGKGERIVIVGRTGAGKTSMISLAAGLYRPWHGIVRLLGEDPAALSPSERRRVIGVVPQTVHMLEGTVQENITLGDPTISGEQVMDVCNKVGLDAALSGLPQGLETRLGRGGHQLSHGQNQLLCLARAMVCSPPMLLLDEPTSGIDSETERAIAETLVTSKDVTLVIVSHRPTSFAWIDRIVVVGDGRIIQQGTREELENAPGWYASMQEMRRLGWTA